MRRMSLATYLWPGLPQLWYEGAWSALALAFGFGLLLNLLLAVTFVWVELLAPPLVTVGWLALAVLWVLSMLGVRSAAGQSAEGTSLPAVEDLFRSAQSEYLRGNWFQAEAFLQQILEQNPRDAEARLLLATLLRHTRRLSEAREQLGCLQRFESADSWHVEIAREREFLAAAEMQPASWLPAAGPTNLTRGRSQTAASQAA
jgi:hypothetical protein